MSLEYGVVVLAAGMGTRLKLDVPKPLAPFMGKKLIDYALSPVWGYFDNSKSASVTLVTGHKRELLESYIQKNYQDKKVSFAFQEKQLGTADALKTYFDKTENSKNTEYTIVLCADTPLLSVDVLSKLMDVIKAKNLDGVAATFKEENPFGYGRIVRKEKGFNIVEQKDGSEEILKINEVNSGVYILKTKFVLENIYDIGSNNKASEFYLTDLFKENYAVEAVCFEDKSCFLGVNDLFQLSVAEELFRKAIAKKLMLENGVILKNPSLINIETTEIGKGTIIEANVSIDATSKIGENAKIEQGVVIKNSQILDGAHIKAYSYLDGAIVHGKASIGPFAHLRPGADIGEDSKIGNFVEIKKSKLEKGVKVSHLSYVGDAFIGDEVNIGCGFITCNYDGANKHVTKIGKGSFIGSDSQTIAPVEIGEDCFVASGTTVTHSMANGAFAISRTKQVTKDGMAHRFIKKK